jgi:hypothetical protein
MSVRFDVALNSFLHKTPPISAWPLSQIFMVKFITSPTFGCIFSTWDGVTYSAYFGANSTDFIWQAGASSQAIGASALDTWFCCVLRWNSLSSRWSSILNMSTGSITHTHDTQVQGGEPFGADYRLGGFTSSALFKPDAELAEYSEYNADIQPGDAQLDDSFLIKVAYDGALSIPSLRKDLIEYRSFRTRMTGVYAPETYFGKLGIQTWTDNNGVTIGSHPPVATLSNGRYTRRLGGDPVVPLFITDTPAVGGGGTAKDLPLMGAG